MKARIADNPWLWTGIVAAIATLALHGRSRIGTGYHLGDIAALLLMVAGTCLILIIQRHWPPAVGELAEG
jgi:CHASE2 domain-containing sensor protein